MNMISDSKEIGLSIIIPCFNESEGISHLTSKLKELEEKLPGTHEFIFVDDGSRDSTFEKLNTFYKNRIGADVMLIGHPVNKGVGAALRTGIENSKGSYIAAIDSDCTYEPAIYLPAMLEIIKKENADMITTSPYHPKGTTLNVPGYRLLLSRNLSRLYNIATGSKFYTYTSMFRIYRRGAIENVVFKSDGFLSMAEIFIKAHKKGYKILEYPAVLTKRQFGESNARIFRIIREHLYFIVNILLGREDI